MSYSVFVQKFNKGKPSLAPTEQVLAILSRFGSVDQVEDSFEFSPNQEDLCEVGFIGVDGDGVNSISFERPVSGGALRDLVFELLEIDGMCYFELDCTYVLARTDVTEELPEGLLEQCEGSKATVISLASEVPL